MKATPYWIDGPWPGRLAILPRPRGGDWLDDEIQSWREAGVQVVLSALTGEEIADLDLSREAEVCQAQGMEFLGFAIEDRGVPAPTKATAQLARQLEAKLAEGRSVAIHCRQGVGRSALLAACLLTVSGQDTDTAFRCIAAARGCPVPDTSEQRDWVGRFAREQLNAVRKT